MNRVYFCDLTVGDVFWDSCQYGNARLTVVQAAEEAPDVPGLWSCRAEDDFGNSQMMGQQLDANGHVVQYGSGGVYTSPAYCGVPWHCDPANIPEGMPR